MVKRLISLIIFGLLIVVLTCCSSKTTENIEIELEQSTHHTEKGSNETSVKIKVPNLKNTEQDIAEENLLYNGLIPLYEYKYSDDVLEGYVIETEPKQNEMVEKNERITVYVSKGPKIISLDTWAMNWGNSSSWSDYYEIAHARIEEGKLYITLANCGIDHEPTSVEGIAASLDSEFINIAPIEIKNMTYQYDQLDSNYYKRRNYSYDIVVSLEKFKVSRVNELYVKVKYINDDFGIETTSTVTLKFMFSWLN